MKILNKIKIYKKLKLLLQFKKSLSFVISFMKSKEVKKSKKLFFVGLAALYVVSPIDGLIVGLDDAAVVAILINWMFEVAPPSLKQQYNL